jgi:hypothetical protein
MMHTSVWKLPPLAKVYEAIGAIADGRVHLEDPAHASVTSSEGDKTYTVEADYPSHVISANDNASFWQGYLGYPAIAVLLMLGLYDPAPNTLGALAGINWKLLNTSHRNNYDLTLAEVLKRAENNGFDPAAIQAEAEAVMQALHEYGPRRGRRLRPPPSIRT